MDWETAIQKKRLQWAAAFNRARNQRHDQTEEALTALMTQLAGFEQEYQTHISQGVTEHEVLLHLSEVARKEWPELWVTMADSVYTGNPSAWVENPFVFVGMIVESVHEPGHEPVRFESRKNQLDSLPKPSIEEDVLDSIAFEAWSGLREHIERLQSQTKDWEYAACMHRVSRHVLALYARLQIEAVLAITRAEEAGQLVEIASDSE
jgi:hypothetical protein